jgi:hypothetical protein
LKIEKLPISFYQYLQATSGRNILEILEYKFGSARLLLEWQEPLTPHKLPAKRRYQELIII